MSFHAGQTFTFGETPSATKWQWVWDNDYALQDWSAFSNDTFPDALIADGDLSASKLDADAIGPGALEIARTTLASAGDLISVTSIPAKRYLYVVMSAIATGGTVDLTMRFNNDSGSNYAWKNSTNFGAPSDSTSATSITLESGATDSGQLNSAWLEIINIAAQEKAFKMISNSQDAAGGGTVPVNIHYIGKWANTSAAINRIDFTNGGTGDMAIGSEAVVYGHD